MCQLQEDLKAQRAITQSLELAVAELRQVHRVGLANVQPVSDVATVTPSLTPAALAEAVARSPPPVAEPTPAARLPSAKCAKEAPATVLAGSTANFPRSQNPAISEIAQLFAAGMALWLGWWNDFTRTPSFSR